MTSGLGPGPARGAQPSCRGLGGGRSALRFPPRATQGAPSRRKASPEASSRAATAVRRPRRQPHPGPAPRQAAVRQPAVDDHPGDSPGCQHPIRLGQSSVSRAMKAAGGGSRKGRTPAGSSRGRPRPSPAVPSGSTRPAACQQGEPGGRARGDVDPVAPVAEPPRIPSARISSPTLTACSQIHPAGRSSGGRASRRSRQASGQPAARRRGRGPPRG